MKDFFRPKPSFWGLLTAAGSLPCVFTVTAFLGKLWWVFDLTSNFRPQYAAGLLLLAAAFGLGRRYKDAVVLCAFAVVNLVLVIPYCCTGRVSIPGTKPLLRATLINVHTENRRYDLVTGFIRDANPDLVVLEEVNGEWMANLAELRTAYPHVCQEPREDNFGVALFSKLPLNDPQIVYLGFSHVPSITAEITVGGKPMRILATHPLPPAGERNTRQRDKQLEAVPALLARGSGSVILLGDLNTTPWSHTFQKLLQDAGLVDSGRGFGLQTTWPSDMFPFRIAIDHCLLSPDLCVVSRRVGRNLGSDHFPLTIEIARK